MCAKEAGVDVCPAALVRGLTCLSSAASLFQSGWFVVGCFWVFPAGNADQDSGSADTDRATAGMSSGLDVGTGLDGSSRVDAGALLESRGVTALGREVEAWGGAESGGVPPSCRDGSWGDNIAFLVMWWICAVWAASVGEDTRERDKGEGEGG